MFFFVVDVLYIFCYTLQFTHLLIIHLLLFLFFFTVFIFSSSKSYSSYIFLRCHLLHLLHVVCLFYVSSYSSSSPLLYTFTIVHNDSVSWPEYMITCNTVRIFPRDSLLIILNHIHQCRVILQFSDARSDTLAVTVLWTTCYINVFPLLSFQSSP